MNADKLSSILPCCCCCWLGLVLLYDTIAVTKPTKNKNVYTVDIRRACLTLRLDVNTQITGTSQLPLYSHDESHSDLLAH